MQLSPDASRAVLELARAAIRANLVGAPARPPCAGAPVAPELSQRAGCFVSLHSIGTHRLRGCVGQLRSDRPLAELVPKMAVACLDDPRFAERPVEYAELPRLLIEVTLIGPLAPAAHPLDFDPLLDGVVLHAGGATGCFLPQVARETGWGREQLLERLGEEKLELAPDAWRRPDARLERFRTLQIGPEPFEPALPQPPPGPPA